MFDSLRRDVRAARRMLAARPAWTAAAILCLAIATGANTAAFTIVNGLLLRPLPFDEPHRLVMVALREPTQTGPRPFALREYRELADQSGATIQLLARTHFSLSLVAGDGARMAQAELVSGNYFETLRIAPFLGRFFDSSADRAGVTLAVLSHRLWQVRFGGNPSVVGQTVRVNGRPVIVAGVAPPGFVGAMQLIAADLWLPAAMYRDLAGSVQAETVPMFGVMGRLAPGVTAEDVEAQLTAGEAALAGARGASAAPAVIVAPAAGFGVPVALQGTVLTLSGVIYVMMALLMAVACANVAALVLARGVGRTREIAVRLSLGASRIQIARQLIVESAALALVGCAAGSFVAVWLTQALVARLTTPFQYVTYAFDVHPDARVFAYAAITTVLATVLCGVAPIRFASRVDVLDVLKQAGGRGGPRGSRRTLNVMVAMQFAVSTTLLVGAGMVARAYVNAASARPGFDPSGLIATTLDVDQIQLDRAAGVRLYQTVLERLSALPGVTSAALTRDLPLGSSRRVTAVAGTDAENHSGGEQVPAAATAISSRYFQTLGVPILHGRSFTDDEPLRPLVAVVNEAMARRLWPNASPLGRMFRLNHVNAEPIEVIGVAANAGERTAHEPPQPAFYQPFPNEYAAQMTAVIRVQGDPGALLAEVRRTIRDVNEDLSIVDLRTMDDVLDSVAEQREVPATALALVAALGLLLSAVGLHGVVAYGVRERARELGIRLALGARPADVRRLVLRQGLNIVAIGMATGIAGTVIFARVVRSTVYGSGALNPAMLAAVCALLTASALAALYLPARWASGLEPAQTLRSE